MPLTVTMASGFKEEEFVQACHSLEQPQLEGWELFFRVVNRHGFSVYRLYDKVSGLYQYKAYGVLEDVPPEVCAGVIMDYRYRQHWDNSVKDVYETEENGQPLVLFEQKIPCLLSNREYVYHRAQRPMEHNGCKMLVTLMRNAPSSIPERPGVVRGDSFTQTCVLMSNGKSGTKFFMYHFENPKGNIPTPMVNMVFKQGVPELILAVQKACQEYQSYKARQQQQRSRQQ